MNEEKIPIWYDMYRQIEYGGNVKPDELMYHYTSADGLMGIIGKEHVKFRFTKYSVLNDTQEGKILKDRYVAICNELSEKGIIDNEVKEAFMGAIEEPIQNYTYTFCDGKGTIIEKRNYNFEDLFICSFSRKQDSLSMWNYYVKNGGYQGYNIKICCPIQKDIRAFRVEYSDEHLKEVMMRYAETINKIGKTGKQYSALLRMLRHYLGFCRLIHKSEYFKHEDEIRLILTAEDAEKKQCKFREKNGILMPYIERDFDKEILRKITVGPLIEREVAKENLELYLENNGYKDVEIDYSKAPIRY